MPFLAKEHIEIPSQDVLSWIFDQPNYNRDTPIFIDAANPSNSISATRAKTLIRKLIAGFKNAGLQEGDSVLIHSFNNIYYPVLVLAVIGFGGVFTGSNPSYTIHELKHQISASGATCVISEPEIIGNVAAAAKEVGVPKERIFLFHDLAIEPSPLVSEAGYQSWATLLQDGERNWEKLNADEAKEKTAMLLFSSGTTGLPKAAQITHGNLLAQHTLFFEHTPRPFTLSRLVALPMFHAATAPSTHTSALKSGHAQYIMRRFDVKNYLSYASQYRITDLTLVPPMVTSIVSLPMPTSQKQSMLKSVKYAIAGAAPLDKSMQARFQELLPKETPFTQIWAMTETSCFASGFPYPENDDTASVGRFLPNLDVKTISDSGSETSGIGFEGRGELCVRGPTVFKGYLNVPRERDFDAEGWFRTGDVCYKDREGDDGKWYIVDRKKELIKVRGFQVAPAELEGVLLDHPAILDVAVIGIPDVDAGSELPRAYVVRKPGTAGDGLKEADVKRWLEDRLAKYKRLDGGVVFVDGIPKTASGKILKRVLREMAKKEIGGKL